MAPVINPVATYQSKLYEKFGIPRQSNLAPAVPGIVSIHPEFSKPTAFRGLEHFSHIWLIFSFNQHNSDNWSPLVRPPRLGGNEKIGVFASRSPYRPNGLGLSVVELNAIDLHNPNAIKLHVNGADLQNNTPIIDIKPYIQYADSIVHAQCSYANTQPEQLQVNFSAKATSQLQQHSDKTLPLIIEQLLQQDPRPAYKKDDNERIYGMSYAELNIKFKVLENVVRVLSIET